MPKKKIFCAFCSHRLVVKPEAGIMRDYCESCAIFYYDNPLPVASSIVIIDQKLLLVKRKNEPRKGEWCLPSGFAETGESIQEAALRELVEETGVRGKIIDLISVDSAISEMYGDVLFVTFEAEWIEGELIAGDDAEEVQFYPLDKLPPLAFESNRHALQIYFHKKQKPHNN